MGDPDGRVSRLAAGAADALAETEVVGAMDRLAAHPALDAGMLERNRAEEL
jgi:hypothetical protein